MKKYMTIIMIYRAHKKTRSVVERGIGQLKRRFHVLHGEIRLSPEKSCQVILACAILHNICKERNIPCPQVDNEDDGHNQQVNNAPFMNNNANDGLRYRQLFAETHFWGTPGVMYSSYNF